MSGGPWVRVQELLSGTHRSVPSVDVASSVGAINEADCGTGARLSKLLQSIMATQGVEGVATAATRFRSHN